MYNPRNYAIQIEKILKTPQSMTGEIERDPITFLSSFLEEKFDSNEACARLIDSFDEKFAKYKNDPLCSWSEDDAKQLVEDLKKIYSM